MLYARIARFDVMVTVALFGNLGLQLNAASRVYKPFVYSEPDQCRGRACNSATQIAIMTLLTGQVWGVRWTRETPRSWVDHCAPPQRSAARSRCRSGGAFSFRHASAWAVSATSFASLESLAVWYELHADYRFQPSASAANKLAWPQE